MYGKQTNTWEEAGQAKGLGVDAIAQAVIGMKKDDKNEVEADFADDFEVAPLQGKKVKYSLKFMKSGKKRPLTLKMKTFLNHYKLRAWTI